MRHIVDGLEGEGCTLSLAPVKKVGRILEKVALEPQARSHPELRCKCALVCDVVRGMITCSSISGVTAIIRRLLDSDDIVLSAQGRLKERFFEQPSPGHWRDVMINFTLRDDPAGHVCELQIAHQSMLKARTALPGHVVYNIIRNYMEIIEYSGNRPAMGRLSSGLVFSQLESARRDLVDLEAKARATGRGEETGLGAVLEQGAGVEGRNHPPPPSADGYGGLLLRGKSARVGVVMGEPGCGEVVV